MAEIKDPHRMALAGAIADTHFAEKNLKSAEEATRTGRDRLFDAQERVQALRASPSCGNDFVEAFMADTTLAPPVVAIQAIQQAEHDVRLWQNTHSACLAQIPIRKNDLDKARRAVAVAARKVMRESGAAKALMQGIEEMQAELVRRRVALRFLQASDALNEDDAILVRQYLRDRDLPGGLGDTEFTNWSMNPVHHEWSLAFDALTKDPNAPLPKLKLMFLSQDY